MDRDRSSKVRTWSQLILRAWGHWVHIVYVVLVIALYFWAGAYAEKDVKVLIAYIAVFCYVLLLMGLLAYFIVSYSRKARYSEAMYCIHSAVHELRNASSYLDRCLIKPIEYESTKFKESLRAVLESVVQAFNIVSAISNRTCIKVLGGEIGNEHVTTLCRDPASHERNKSRDVSEGQKHKVNLNTDYHLLVRAEQRYFLSNNLKKYPNYMNTSLNANDKSSNDGRWSLPYVSSLVLPIRYIEEESCDASRKDTRITILGFLAIDSQARGAYTERYDVEMGAIIADALYSVLSRWIKLEEASKHARANY